MYSLIIVDDEDTIRGTLKIALEGRCRLADFPDAESAVAAARIDPPDLVLLDLGMAHESVDRHFFREALLVAGGNETRAAQLLRINYSTFRYRRRKLGL